MVDESVGRTFFAVASQRSLIFCKPACQGIRASGGAVTDCEPAKKYMFPKPFGITKAHIAGPAILVCDVRDPNSSKRFHGNFLLISRLQGLNPQHSAMDADDL